MGDYVDYNAWTDAIEEETERKRKEADKRAKAAREQGERALAKAKERHGDYWTGPFGVSVPWKYAQVPAEDRVNYMSYYLSDDGTIHLGTTLIGTNAAPYTADEYRGKFCTYDVGGDRWIYAPKTEATWGSDSTASADDEGEDNPLAAVNTDDTGLTLPGVPAEEGAGSSSDDDGGVRESKSDASDSKPRDKDEGYKRLYEMILRAPRKTRE